MDRPIKWLDGSIDSAIPGKLLSENVNYFGDCIMTGISYKYLTELTGIGDTAADEKDLTGRRLIDGLIVQRYDKLPAENSNGKMEVLFDLKGVYSVREFDFKCEDNILKAVVSVSKDGENFTDVCDKTEVGKLPLIRCKFDEAEARYIKLSLKGENSVRLFQIWIWGDAAEDGAAGDGLKGSDKFQYANSIAQESIMGMNSSAFTDVEGFDWGEMIKKQGLAKYDAVWSEADSYGAVGKAPFLPTADKINKTVTRRICRGGSEVVLLALTNTDTNDTKDVTVELINNSGLRIKMYTVGVIDSRWYGTAASPLFNEECTIAKPLMRKYIKNAPVIEDFPLVHLPVAGTCLVWLVVFADENEAGDYSFTLKAGNSKIEVKTEVLPITLREEKHGISTWSTTTYMYPFEYVDRIKKDAEYRNELGVNVYESAWPEEGTVPGEAFKTNPTTQFAVGGLGKYEHLLYCNLVTAEEVENEAEEYITELLDSYKKKAESLGLTTDRWYLALPDEPGAHNADAIAAMVKLCKRIAPDVRIYANPAFWTGFENGAVSGDEELMEKLSAWYNDIDISVPLLMNLNDRPNAYKLYTAERDYNGQYLVSGQHMTSDRKDLISLSRCSAWESIARDLIWWGFYSYYCPRLDTWNNRLVMDRHVDFTINYQCVHAGVNGPVPTRASEGIREGYQDFRIMQRLKEKDIDTYKKLQQEFLNGNKDFDYLRNTAIDALLK